jgi:hypothetical protein
MTRFEIWVKRLLAAAISGAAGGVFTGLAAVGVDPQHFNMQTGMGAYNSHALTRFCLAHDCGSHRRAIRHIFGLAASTACAMMKSRARSSATSPQIIYRTFTRSATDRRKAGN